MSRAIRTATTLTIGIMLICLPVHAFACAEDAAAAAASRDGRAEANDATRLREAMQKAKEDSGR